MATVTYEQILTRQVEVDVTDAELALLKGKHCDERDMVQTKVVEEALAIIEAQNIEPEFVTGTCTDEDDEELFDIG